MRAAHSTVCLEYRHPQTGGPVLPTMACWVQLLRPANIPKRTAIPAARFTTSSRSRHDGHRRDSASTGVKAISSRCRPGRCMSTRIYRQAQDAVLFSIQDSPVLNALGLYYEETQRERRPSGSDVDV